MKKTKSVLLVVSIALVCAVVLFGIYYFNN